MYSLWNGNERILELKSRHVCYNYELESMREELLGEIGMHHETTNVLFQLLSEACQERDKALEQLKRSVAEISQLKKLLNNKLLPTSNINNSVEISSAVSHAQPDHHSRNHQKILKGNFDVKLGSDSVSEAYNNCSEDSSAADSISDTLFKKSFVQDSGGRTTQVGKASSKDLAVSPSSKVINTIVKGKPLPAKGRFLEAVLDTAPLLQTVMITGQLPKWRNPPPLPSNLIANDHGHGSLINHRAGINSKTAMASSSTMLGYKKCSKRINFECWEHAGMKKRFR